MNARDFSAVASAACPPASFVNVLGVTKPVIVGDPDIAKVLAGHVVVEHRVRNGDLDRRFIQEFDQRTAPRTEWSIHFSAGRVLDFQASGSSCTRSQTRRHPHTHRVLS